MNLSDLPPIQPANFSWMTLAAIVIAYVVWKKLTAGKDKRYGVIFWAALLGAYAGSKLLYVIAEGGADWVEPDRWQRLAYGKSILGGLLGGYIAVRWAKFVIQFDPPTGDVFALIAPAGIMLGRVGCLINGCCFGSTCADTWYALHDKAGIARWPVVPAEIGFNAIMLVVLWILKRKWGPTGQLFHLYMIGYGAFRFCEEFLRDRNVLVAGLDAYQVAALCVIFLGTYRYVARKREMLAAPVFAA